MDGEQDALRREAREAADALVALVILGGIYGSYRLLDRRGSVMLPSSAAEHDLPSVAVLPFDNRSPDPAHAYFAGALHDELLTQLSRVRGLRIISRTSVMGYAAARRSVRDIAAELGVSWIVEGGVQVLGDRLRVNVQLIDAGTDGHLWAERYDRTLGDAFAIQSEIAQRIVAAVGASLLALASRSSQPVFVNSIFFIPPSLYAAWAHRILEDAPAARAAFDSARAILDSVGSVFPEDWRVHAGRGMALAGLGLREEARDEARWLERSRIYQGDAALGPRLAEARARILAGIGDADEALDEIERLLETPSFLSAHTLRLDPRWDPIREHPRFQELLQKHSVPPPG